MERLFHQLSEAASKLTTELYSTSFSSAIKILHKELRAPIFNIYGFVRLADEIVDTFHQHDKAFLLADFKRQTYDAIERGISLNPILHSFQLTVNRYQIDHELIEAFFHSMEMDLNRVSYDREGYEEYIYGSAEVVGLMCLFIFCDGNREQYDELKGYARSLGAAFQKVNFLRDLKADYVGMERIYFPGCDFNNFSQRDKEIIEEDIQRDFDHAYQGILALPPKARFGVYVAYKYYLSLFRKIKKVPPQNILQYRIRIPDHGKMLILAKAGIRSQLNLL
ncbi:MAG: phytoene/squalene synthase family protein [Chitinophagaceae bacterium]|nr:phytoene/squalene synthase family protein [Chitinophagaceae bacterium]MCA6500059.1 phytoene/squalene synthase family protein [Chitinophagaceae bacterium]MCA6515409.1 phytoene/squalene synthase family protein [Chitinophagaceae bacterium]